MGYTGAQLREHIQAQFQPGMSWENYGEWQVDHIKGRLEYVREGETRIEVINALSNLQPLWASENVSKANKSNANTPSYFRRFQ